MINIEVKLNKTLDDSYNIFIGKGITEFIFEEIKKQNLAYSYVIITDSNVKQLYGDNLLKKMRSIFPRVELISFPAGEQNKNRETKSYLEDRMLELKFARDSEIIALGGGVVGDIAGFVAATYVRGLNYIQIPTSLVACVDSSIGGKTAVDTKHGKNLIGAFHQPKAVFIDTNTLKTLNKKEINEGLSEVIKYGVIMDNNFFSYLEKNIEKVNDHDDEVIFNIIKTSCMIKAQVVKKDEKESNLRKILNFGHTIGHAIEQLSKYKISHGEAISIGMVLEGKIAMKITSWSEDDQKRLIELLKKTELPTNLPDNMDVNNIIEIMKLDKKVRKGKIEISLPDSIGTMFSINHSYGINVEEELIKSVFT